MEANVYGVSHFDADALLPPRKRLLAGLRKQNFDANSNTRSSSGATSEFDSRLDKLLRSHLSKPNCSTEEIIESSSLAAEAAVKVAEAARAAADEKAARAAKAVAAAQSALKLVAIVSEEAARRDGTSKKNKMKRSVPVELLYNKHEFVENCETDDGLPMKLHQVMNSSPRISKNPLSSYFKGHRQKKLKSSSSSSSSSAGSKAQDRGMEWDGKQHLLNNGNGVETELDSEASIPEDYDVRAHENTQVCNKTDSLKMEKKEAKSLCTNEKIGESINETSIGRKRGNFKQKKLPSNMCNSREQTNPIEEPKSSSTLTTEENITRISAGNQPLFSMGCTTSTIIPAEKISGRKCQEFKSPSACAKQNKVLQS